MTVMRLSSFALFILFAAHCSIQSPVATDRKGKKLLAIGTSRQVQASVSTKTKPQPRGILSRIDAHPTIKAFSSLYESGGAERYHKNRNRFLERDPILQEAAKAETVDEYIAHFNKLRPAADDVSLDAKARKGINNSVTFLMASHMRYLNKPEDFQRLAKGGIARLCSTAGYINRLKRKKVGAELLTGEDSGQKRLSETQRRNASIFRADMIKAGFELRDDPVRFEEDSRVLIDIEGKKASTWNLKDFLAVEGKDQAFIDQVRNLRLYNNNEGRQKKRKLEQKGQQSKQVSLSPRRSYKAADRKGKKSVEFSQATMALPTLPKNTLAPNAHKDHTDHYRVSQGGPASVLPSSSNHHDKAEQSGDRSSNPHSAHKSSSSTVNDEWMDDAAFWKAMLSD